jgi:two-component system, NtrC family, sensor histidine kinase PilS
MWLSTAPWLEAGHPRSPWRSLYHYNLFRLGVALLLLAATGLLGDELSLGSRHPRLFLHASLSYVAATLASLPFVILRGPRLEVQLSLQVLADIAFVMILSHASGGVDSGLGLLLLASLALAGSINRGRMTVFYAAIATLGTFSVEAYEVLALGASNAQPVEAPLLGIAYFATAWLAHKFAGYTAGAEELAARREVDLANLAQVNQLIIQDMQDGVLVVDEEGLIRQRNAAAEKLLGKPAKTRGELLFAEYAPELYAYLQRWRENPAKVQYGKPVTARFVPVGRERYCGAVIFLEDQRRIEAQAQQLKLAALGRLTTNIAHEIRNPLSAISHATELLLEEEEYDATQSRLLRIIGDNTQRLNRMVQEVLKLGRWAGGRPEAISLKDFLRRFVVDFSDIEKIPPGIFSTELESDCAVVFDPSHLNQVMWNLSRNALRYSKNHPGSIRFVVAASPDEDKVKLDVIDDGPGVPVALRNQLFEPFFTTMSTGTGLGLCIAREVCEANGATLEYVPAERGAQFRVLCRGTQ